MKSFFLALGFFTRLPVPKTEFTEESYAKALKLAPLVGFVIGLILWLIALLFDYLEFSSLIRGAVLTGVYILLTGGLHFDGLSDTSDGMLSGRSREQSLEIMKDSRIGVFGTLAIFMAGLLYFVFMTEIIAPALIVFAVCGRACLLISASMAPYARSDGMGKAASAAGGAAAIIIAITAALAMSLLMVHFTSLPLITPVAIAVAVLVTVCITAGFKKKLGGVTGDTFGAVIEISSLVFLFAFLILWHFFVRG